MVHHTMILAWSMVVFVNVPAICASEDQRNDTESEMYIGCFKVTISNGKKTSASSVAQCRSYCSNNENNMIALRNGHECFCVVRADAKVHASECNISCSGDKKLCGGNSSYVVYRVKEVRSVSNSILGKINLNTDDHKYKFVRGYGEFSFASCSEICSSYNLTYFFMLPKKVNNCICFVQGIEPDLDLADKGTCQIPCPTGSQCDVCFSYNIDSYVMIFTNCLSLNGDCGKELKCVVVAVNGRSYHECVCPKGKVLNRFQRCESYRVNLAYLKKAYIYYEDASSLLDGSQVTDGLIVQETSTKLGVRWIGVQLMKDYYIAYVTVFNSLRYTGADGPYLKNFSVGLGNVSRSILNDFSMEAVVLCGDFSSESNEGIPMRIFCENTAVTTNFVVVYPKDGTKNSNIGLNEIEVYPLGKEK
ncbi:hypothetical protein HELRODRAFT_177880 [Helobdella robusta]|uniref:WSC domain-containing protein n=1 Tax=Helobdella robusta TaxID=6412 RepID=T1FCE9_HELRO|nr:hypothetical protein HELRODRAFT_177880 [Helobdella robusta]ESN97815.1 hypothetical protein HELRODRAFT_177880 [Helobdella robusta]